MAETTLYLQNIVNNDNLAFDKLPASWQEFDFNKFSKEKTLFDFQVESLKNTVKALYLFYAEDEGSKNSFFKRYKDNNFKNNFDYDLKEKKDGKTVRFLLEYPDDYPQIEGKISFEHFINRMSFWMATGAGKTLVIVKLIELLGKLILDNQIPKNDILFLSHRDDLLLQFKKHIDEYNAFNPDKKINLKNLKDYENVKHENVLPFSSREITVFYYRSDLISDEQKEKIVNFKNYDNNGKWYILSDEAHKGDSEDSKRQILYTILSRNGFLFNFSATFVEPQDYTTCVFNFNLAKFIENGYGKHVYVSTSEVTAFKNKNNFSRTEKQKIVLKTLTMLTYINKHLEKVREYKNTLYHQPLLLALVNSVNTEDADLELFFKELAKISLGEINDELFQEAKKEIIEELKRNPTYLYEENTPLTIEEEIINNIRYEDILNSVFNASAPGKIEVLKIPGNKKEIIFKLQTTDKPFALIKIGDISDWLKNKLENYTIIEGFENESYFNKINAPDSSIKLLMGSRSFYEGWDSNRPNIILFINIGVGENAKKFVLQSVGRGVRISPLKNKRKRIQNLYNAIPKEIETDLYNKIQQNVLPLESLYVFGTNAEILNKIMDMLKEEKGIEKDLGKFFAINKEAKNHDLLIPVYRDSDKVIAEEKEPEPYPISEKDYELAKKYFNYLGKEIIMAKFENEPKIIKLLNSSLETEAEKEKKYNFSEKKSVEEPNLIIKNILNYFNSKSRQFDTFKKLENEIVHYKNIKFILEDKNDTKYKELLEKIKKVSEYGGKKKDLKKLDLDFEKDKDTQKYRSKLEEINNKYQEENDFDVGNEQIKIRYLANHYYLSVVVSKKDKISYLTHIVDVASEVKFLNGLEEYLKNKNNIFKNYDWWMFSKLDETLDEIYIPYYNSNAARMAKFKPDFIFWLQKENNYTILFVDPKGTEHVGGERKIDGYEEIFLDKKNGTENIIEFEKYKIKTKLLLMTAEGGIADVPAKYRKYWFDNFPDFENKLK